MANRNSLEVDALHLPWRGVHTYLVLLLHHCSVVLTGLTELLRV
jgi:hypothetical protein